MTVRGLVVDDEPDIEPLFRQQFRREVREGLYTLDFALSAGAAFMISDYGDAERVKTAPARGADGFLTKPVDFRKLKQVIIGVRAEAIGGNG